MCECPPQYPDSVRSAQIPYANVAYQLSVNRMPLPAIIPNGAATAAFNTLWCIVEATLAEPAPAAKCELTRTAAFAKAVLDLIAKLGGEADDAVADEAARGLTSAAPPADVQACTHRIRLEVQDE